MGVREGLLALLERGPAYGYQLRAEFEGATGGVWPLNVGQVYATLSRLERDGLVDSDVGMGGADGGKVIYRLTVAGRCELERWLDAPLERASRPRDELAIKLALAVATPGVDVRRVLQVQRTATLRTLRELTRLKAQVDSDADAGWLLVNELMILQADAEARWLDHCEAQLAGMAPLERSEPSVALSEEAPR